MHITEHARMRRPVSAVFLSRRCYGPRALAETLTSAYKLTGEFTCNFFNLAVTPFPPNGIPVRRPERNRNGTERKANLGCHERSHIPRARGYGAVCVTALGVAIRRGGARFAANVRSRRGLLWRPTSF